MNKKLSYIVLAVVLSFGSLSLPTTGSAQSLPNSLISKLDLLFARWNKDDAPGCAAGVVRGDQLVYAKGFGLADLENKTPNTPATIFYMCSVSKQFAGYAIALLAGEGKIKLDEDMHTYLPWMGNFGKKITVRNLVNHTSGLRDDIGLAQFYGLGGDGMLTQELALQMLKRQHTLNFNPGEKFSYSNSNYVLLAEIVKKVTGMSFKDYTDSAIFRPLEMTASAFADDHSRLIAGRAQSYEKNGEVFHNAGQNVYTLGDGGLFTSVNDMAKWVTNFYEPKAGALKDVALMTTPGKLNDGSSIPYAMGINVNTDRGYKRLTHNGGLAGYRTIIAIYPELKTSFYIFGNAGDGEVYNEINQMAELLIPDRSAKKQPQTPASPNVPVASIKDSTELVKFGGSYIAANGYKITVNSKPGKLYVNGNVELEAEGQGLFHMKTRSSVKYQFSADPQTKVVLAKLISPVLAKPIEMERVSEVQLSRAQLSEYAGRYFSDEVGAFFDIVVKNDVLSISDKYHDPVKVRLFGTDHLFTDYDFLNHVRVVRNNKGGITGFELNTGDTAGMVFMKQTK
ncbi:class C beta-lactamase-related serine hydrolase [Pedobacter chinensis]|uniref:Class C beta-lactamase-related serine hydrolase n=1 Tax=Pedobacter chinensis TaxID=2282421 RepID=A0A369Q2P9_9SPHI|nr:serine hydrolase domain-containing protein [Pedobacter chinensis]RDC57219.1 class C beta-lactamase-related serine hydrolase [Pedobacter chinensis]